MGQPVVRPTSPWGYRGEALGQVLWPGERRVSIAPLEHPPTPSSGGWSTDHPYPGVIGAKPHWMSYGPTMVEFPQFVGGRKRIKKEFDLIVSEVLEDGQVRDSTEALRQKGHNQ